MTTDFDAKGTSHWMLLLGRKTAREKVATFLFDMGCRLHADADWVIALPLSRQQIADILGTTIGTVSRQMTDMKRMGVIHRFGRHGERLMNTGALQALAG